MAKVTEKDIVEYLNERIAFHRQEAKRLEELLNGIIHVPAAAVDGNAEEDTSVSAAPKYSSEKPAQRKKTQSIKPESAENFDIPDKYTDDLSINSKILFALKEIGSGFKEDVANTMAQYEPRSDEGKIIRQIDGPLSNLKAQGKIDVEKIGRKYRFKLISYQ